MSQLTAIEYTPDHFNEIDSWFKHYDLKMEEELLPTTGVIVPGMAAGFIYLTNSPQAWIEHLVKNPHLDKETSNQALDLVIEGLVKIGKEHGVKIIVSDTLFNSVALRAVKHGSSLDPNKYTRLYRSLDHGYIQHEFH